MYSQETDLGCSTFRELTGGRVRKGNRRKHLPKVGKKDFVNFLKREINQYLFHGKSVTGIIPSNTMTFHTD